MNAALRAELARLGIDAEIEGRERLALIVPRAGVDVLASSAVRDALQAAARRDGYTHLAVELTDASPGDAPLSRRQPA